MRQMILDGTLTIDQRKRGFRLVEPDDHLLYLVNGRISDKPLAVYHQNSVLPHIIRQDCDALAMKYGFDESKNENDPIDPITETLNELAERISLSADFNESLRKLMQLSYHQGRVDERNINK